jgi:beta-lactamase regulating signal transducer with metallopeptidase domain
MPFISQSNFLQALGWAVFNSLWQMALLWLIYKVFILICRPGSSLKTKAAFTLLISGTVWFIINFILAFNTPVTNHRLFTWEGSGYSVNNTLQSLLPYASIIYLMLLAIPLVRFIVNTRQVMQIRTKKIKKIEVQWRLFVKKMAAYLEIRKPVQVWVSENITSPLTIGFFKPVILVPLAAVNQLSPQQMEAVLLHELAHIKRFDYLINIIAAIIKTIFYFNPFTRNLASIIEDEREKSCDEWVLQYQYDAYTYSSALLTLEKLRTVQVHLALAAAGKKELLLSRIKKIMGIPSTPVYSLKKTMGWISGLSCSVLLFFILFANAIKTETVAASFAASPYGFSDNSNQANNMFTALNNTRPVLLKGKVQQQNKEENNDSEADAYNFIPYLNDDIIPAGLNEAEVSAPDEEKELQVKEAVEVSKKILEELKWKEVESSVADAMTDAEKNKLEKSYQQAMAAVDWKELENKLLVSYNQLNWDKINLQLKEGIRNIKIDSITHVYATALKNISLTQKQLCEAGLTGIPDSEISIKEIEAAKTNLTRSLEKLKAAKQKKIIRL